MCLSRFIKEVQDFLDKSAVEDNQEWDDQFHNLRQTLPLLFEGSASKSIPLHDDSIRSTSSENKMFGMQVASDEDLLDAELLEATPSPPVLKQVEPPVKPKLSGMEMSQKVHHMKREGHSSSLHLHRKPKAPTGER